MTTEEAMARGIAKAKAAMAEANGNGQHEEAEEVSQLGAYAVEAAARDALEAGLCVIRAETDGTKRPLGEWKRWQSKMPTAEQVHDWFGGGHQGMGLVTGEVSGGLECFEFEGRANEAGIVVRFRAAMTDAGLGAEWDRISHGYSEQTPTKGFHVLWRCEAIAGNQKLARRASPETGEVEVLIETRGEGGFVIVAPSWGPTHPTGAPWVRRRGSFATVATISHEVRERILALARTFDELPDEEVERAKPLGEKGDGGTLPGFDLTHEQILKDHGFDYHHTDRSGNTHWTRPGKDAREGSSLTVWADDGRCTPWSTSIAMPGEFITGSRLLTPWQLHVGLEHKGDFGAAARQWRKANGPEVKALVRAPDPGFWMQRPILAQSLAMARARRCSPWAVLGNLLTRVAAAIPPFVVLPPRYGGHMSLNLFVGLVGPSGAGKDASIACARDAYPIRQDFTTVGVGSGEGILDQYVVYRHPKGDDEGGIDQHTTSVIFTAAEVQTLGALKGRTSATLMPLLRMAYMGDELSFAYAARDRRLRVHAHRYRLCLVVGIQPEHANVLLEETSGGTPQRFLWMPALDPEAPDDAPPQPEPLPELRLPQWTSFKGGLVELEVCDEAYAVIDATRLARVRGEGEALDGHALATQLKVAAILGIEAGRTEVTEDDWRLAGQIQAVSDVTRASAIEALRTAAARTNRARAEARAEADVIVREALEDADAQALERTGELILERLGTEWISASKLRKSLTSGSRRYFDLAIEDLIEAGSIEADETEYRGQKALRFRIAGDPE